MNKCKTITDIKIGFSLGNEAREQLHPWGIDSQQDLDQFCDALVARLSEAEDPEEVLRLTQALWHCEQALHHVDTAMSLCFPAVEETAETQKEQMITDEARIQRYCLVS